MEEERKIWGEMCRNEENGRWKLPDEMRIVWGLSAIFLGANSCRFFSALVFGYGGGEAG